MLFQRVFFIGYVPTESMEPAIKTGSFIFGYRITGEVKQGDIVVFSSEGFMLVKRAAAVPGDMVYIDDNGIISINEESPDAAMILCVPDGCYFMLGDNAENSNDSRSWEEMFIRKNQIIAKIRK
jgi:signal peptidase I